MQNKSQSALTMMDMHTVQLHLIRLRRHYDHAVQTYDHVSLLDLSHSLRNWVELSAPLTTIAPEFSTVASFKTATPAKEVLRAARGHRYVLAYMPGGVITYANKGHLASAPSMPEDGDIAIAVGVKVSAAFIELAKYCFVSRSFDQPFFKALNAELITQCTYTQWLDAEAVRVSCLNQQGSLQVFNISRKMIVKRVANTLDGSHPSAASSPINNVHPYDAPIHRLLQYQMGGLPLPYFILLKIAQDILQEAHLLHDAELRSP